MEHELNYLSSLKQFAEGWINGNQKWIQLYPYKSWDHPLYGTTTITPEIAQKFVENFDSHVRGQEIHSGYEHGSDPAKGTKASGKYLKVEARDDGPYALVEFTDEAKKEIDAGEWNYWSTEHFDQWTHPTTKETHEFVLAGGGLTNKPFVKDMVPLNFSELMLADPELKMPESVLAAIEASNVVIDDVIENLGVDEPVILDEPTNPNNGEGMDELLKKFSELFGLPEDSDEVAVLKFATDMKSDIEPLRELQKGMEQKKSFAERYPDEAQELLEGRQYRQEQEVKRFSESLASGRMVRKVAGENDEIVDEPTGLGLSALAVEKAAEVIKMFSEGTATVDSFKQFTEAILDNGIVDYGTHGSSREDETDDTNSTAISSSDTPQQIRKKFSERIDTLATSEFEGNVVKAYAEAQVRWPEEFATYRNNKPQAA